MPRGDRTGPEGRGPMTGRRAGYCAGFEAPGFATGGFGRGMGYGRGRGMGYGRGMGRGRMARGYPCVVPPAYAPAPYPTPFVQPEPTPEEEKAYLGRMVKDLEYELREVKARLEELAKDEKKE